MRSRSATGRAMIAIAVTFALMLSAMPAWADDSLLTSRGPVTNDVVVGGVHLLGLTEAAARAAIEASVVVPTMASLQVNADVKHFTFQPSTVVSLDVTGTLDRAYESTSTTGTFQIAPVCSVNTTAISTWMKNTAKKVNHNAVNSTRIIRSRRYVITKSSPKVVMNVTTGNALVQRAILNEIASLGTTQPAVTIPVTRTAARVTERSFGKIILVVISERRVLLYNGAKLLKNYRCAVGRAAYPTPVGTWKVMKKVMLPSWHNPHVAWSSGMADVIGPGPHNPLGTRALYLNADGIRIHGTANVASIGTAASHGCIRLKRHDVEELFPLVPVGTTVKIIK
jgi:lipoprotein-anchoring transpeptidase ErfK/SrfK